MSLHKYSHNAQEITTKIVIFTCVALAFVWGAIQELFKLKIPWWFDSPSIVAFYGVLVYVYDRWLWGMFRFFHKVEDYSGEYDVEVKSSRDEYDSVTSGKAFVVQSWSSISIELRFEYSISLSSSAVLELPSGSGRKLVYTYNNEPNGSAPSSMVNHKGTAELFFETDGKSARGNYYTGRGRMNHGEMTLKKVSND